MNDIQNTLQQTPITEKKIKVIFCIPAKTFSNHFFMAWTELIHTMIKCNKYEIIVSNKYSPHPSLARSLCLGLNNLLGPTQKPFQDKIDYDVIVWLDPHILFNFQSIEYLIECCMKYYPVVSGVYSLEDDTKLCCIEKFDSDYFSKNGIFEYMTVEKRNEILKSGKEWLKCDYAGMGCMVFRKGIFEDERLKYPYFSHNTIHYSSIYKNIHYICDDNMNEEMCLIRNLIESGIIDSILVTLKIRFGYEKNMIVS